MQTGENEQALRKILDMTRFISLGLLLLHFYFIGYGMIASLGYQNLLLDQLISNLARTGLFRRFNTAKWLALASLCISLLGARGRKQEKAKPLRTLALFSAGVMLFLGSGLLMALLPAGRGIFIYDIICFLGWLLTLAGGTRLSRLITGNWNKSSPFNAENETFPQEERYLHNEYSINLPAKYQAGSKTRNSWINIINPFRGLLVLGNPGSGKSYFVIQHVIKQHIEKGFCLFVYDFKYDDLTKIAYELWENNQAAYPVAPAFYTINFDDLSKSHRCNPLDPESLLDITDAAESARTILLGLNKEWIGRQGDFFVESPINFLTAIIWYLKKHENGQFCTLPHAIELMQADYESLFQALATEPEIEVLINPFVSALKHKAMDQLEGQIASAKISLARLASPQLYYVLSGNDFQLDINNPKAPKIVCMGNNPQKTQVYGAVLSLYVNRLIKLINQKGKQKCSLVFDEFPTIYLPNMDQLIATARSNLIATCLGVQDLSQLRKDYGKDQADVIMNITGNVIAGQVTGDCAKQLSDRFGKIIQDRKSVSINSQDLSLTTANQLDNAIPPSTIATLSSGTFVGIVADNPDCRIPIKMFHADIQQPQAWNHRNVKVKMTRFDKKITDQQVRNNFDKIRDEALGIYAFLRPSAQQEGETDSEDE